MNRIVVTALFFASALVLNVGCQKIDSPEPEKPEDRVITDIRQLGASVTLQFSVWARYCHSYIPLTLTRY